jgi:hypothetical protein
MRSPALLLSLFLSSALSAAVRVSPPGPLADLPLGAAAGNQSSPQAASDGDGFLVVYNSLLSPPTSLKAVRLDARGVVRDMQPLTIAEHVPDFAPAAVAFGRDRYLVVWHDTQQIFARTVTRDGTLGETTVVAQPQLITSHVRVAFDGTHFLIVWADGASSVVGERNTMIRGAMLDGDGRITKNAFDLARTNNGFALDVAALAGRFLVMGAEVQWDAPLPIGPNGYPSHFFTARVDDAGNVSERVDYDPVTTVFDLQVASNGVDFLAAWEANAGIAGPIQTMHIDANGAAAPRTHIATGLLHVDDVEWDGRQYIVLFDDGTTSRVVNEQGAQTIVATPPDARTRDGALASNGRITLAALTALGFEQFLLGGAGAGSDITAKFLDRSLTLIDPRMSEPASETGAGIDVSFSAPYRALPTIATNATGALAVWYEVGDEGVSTLIARPLTSDGRPGGVPVPIAQRLQTTPRAQLASDGNNFLVVFRYGLTRELVAMRLTPDGRPIDREPIVVATDEYVYDDPQVTFDGSKYVITYLAGVINLRGGPGTSVYAASVSTDGKVVETNVRVSNVAPPTNIMPSIASLGDGRSLIVWWVNSSVFARFVRGASPDSGMFFVAPATGYPRVAASGGSYAIAMRTSKGVAFASVSSTGVARQNFMPAIIVPNDITNLSVMPVARGVLVVWNESDIMRAMLLDSEANVIAQPSTIGVGVPGTLPSSSFAPFIYNDATNVFTRELEFVAAPARIRVTQR